MKISNLAFIGIKGSVIALNLATGEQVWVARLKGGEFVNVVLHDDLILAASGGEIFCLDPFTGEIRWHNPLKGFGLGLITIATTQSPGGGAVLAAEKRNRDQQAASASSGAGAAG